VYAHGLLHVAVLKMNYTEGHRVNNIVVGLRGCLKMFLNPFRDVIWVVKCV
jgi:hypothetical protein